MHLPDPDQAGLFHIVGIGGIGMSAIAEVMHTRGYHVQGSDLKDSANLERLRARGITCLIGHDPANFKGAGHLVISSAVKPGNPEFEAAKERGLPIIRRAEMLAELMRPCATVSVTGTRGSTTATSLIADLLNAPISTRERERLRAGVRDLDVRRQQGAPRRRPAGRGHRVDQHVRDVRRVRAVRRTQALGVRNEDGSRAVPAFEVGVGRPHGGGPDIGTRHLAIANGRDEDERSDHHQERHGRHDERRGRRDLRRDRRDRGRPDHGRRPRGRRGRADRRERRDRDRRHRQGRHAGPGRPALPSRPPARAGATICRSGSTWTRAGTR